jgi:hypothetical protein
MTPGNPSPSHGLMAAGYCFPRPLAGEGRGPSRSDGKGEGLPGRRRLRAALALLAIGVALLATAAHAADPWKEVRSKEGAFTARFPADPKINIEPPDPSGGVTNVFLAALGQMAFEVSYTDYGARAFAGRSLDAIYNLARDDLVKGQPVKLLVDRKIMLDGLPGREVIFAAEDGYTQDYRFFVMQARIYAVIAGGPAGMEKSPEAKRFLDSFKLILKK